MAVASTIRNLGRWIRGQASLARSTEHAEPFIVTAALLTIVGHPLFYVIWRFGFPQPFESISIRLVGGLICVPFVFKNHWPGWSRNILPYYFHFAVLYNLPFFFSLFLFLNDYSLVWVLSAIAGTFLLTFIVSWVLAVALIILGVIMSLVLFEYFGVAAPLATPLPEVLPVYLFVLCLGGAINYQLQRYREIQAAFEKRLRLISGQNAMMMREHNHLLSRFLNNIIINRLRSLQDQHGLEYALKLITQQEKRFCGIMQADIRNFTKMFDVDSELKVAQLISQCFSEITEIGQDLAVIKPIGDCIFVYSDEGQTREETAINILALASFFVHSVEKINRPLIEGDMPPLNFGIALHVGEVIYGNLASDTMIDPTVIGLNVNKTARMEELTKIESVQKRVGANAVIVSEEFYWIVQKSLGGGDAFVCIRLDELRVSIRDFPAVKTVYALQQKSAMALYPFAMRHIQRSRMAKAPKFDVTERNVRHGVEYYYEMHGMGPNTTWSLFIDVTSFAIHEVTEIVRGDYRHLKISISRGKERWLTISTANFPGEHDETDVEEWIFDVIDKLSSRKAPDGTGRDKLHLV